MTVYALLWELIKHALHGRGSDEVYLQVTRDSDQISHPLTGALEDFIWPESPDRFCVLSATDRDGLT